MDSIAEIDPELCLQDYHREIKVSIPDNCTEVEHLTKLLIKESRECQLRGERIQELEGQVNSV